jgi:6-pyruvoyl tetrahydropterin synthase/QueD family protein
VTTSVVVRHNFETAHRLPFLGGKCTNLHGHSWWAEITVSGEPDDNGVLLEFSTLKTALRGWIDTNLDHGAMLGAADPLCAMLQDVGSKVFVFDTDDLGGYCFGGGSTGRPLPWPTVENVAELIRRVTVDWLASNHARPVSVHVRVQETHVNQAVAVVDHDPLVNIKDGWEYVRRQYGTAQPTPPASPFTEGLMAKILRGFEGWTR